MRRAPASALAAALSLAACAGLGETARDLTVPAGERSPEYREALDRWTRRAEAPDRANAALSVAATLKSAEFRERYAREYGAAYRLSEEEIARAVEAQRAEAERSVEFLLFAYASDRKANDLDRPDSVWRIYLELPDGRRAAPASIETENRRSRVIEGFYPLGDAWSRAYRVRFDAAALPEEARERPRLVVAGVLGALALAW